ncbi:hypothetical protein Tco_1236746 [Tanacetum coccineum]
MSSDNASSAVTYMSVSSGSNGPSSWGIPLINASELPEMDPYEESQSTQSTTYHQMMEDESLGYIADSYSMEDDTDMDSIDYPDEPGIDDDDLEDEDEDPEEDPSEEHDIEDEDEDPEEDPSEEHEPEDEDAKKDEPSEDSDVTKPFKENETATTPPPPRSP